MPAKVTKDPEEKPTKQTTLHNYWSISNAPGLTAKRNKYLCGPNTNERKFTLIEDTALLQSIASNLGSYGMWVTAAKHPDLKDRTAQCLNSRGLKLMRTKTEAQLMTYGIKKEVAETMKLRYGTKQN